MLRITNKIIVLLNEKWSALTGIENRLYVWLQENHVQTLDYRDKSLNGPACKLFLDKKLQALKLSLPRSLRDFIEVFRAFDIVRYGNFGCGIFKWG